MASIAEWIEKIKTAIYGEEVRGAIWRSLQAMNDELTSADVTQIPKNKQDIAGLKTDVTTVQGDVTTLKTDVTQAKSDVTNLKASDTEMKDIRVGADGAVYENAGTAVRSQVNGLNGRLVYSLQETQDYANYGKQRLAGFWERGDLSGDTERDNKYRVRMVEEVSYPYDITIKANEGYAGWCIIYATDPVTTIYFGNTDASKKVIPANTNFRAVIRKDPEDASIVADVDMFASQVIIDTYIGGKIGELDAKYIMLNGHVEEVKKKNTEIQEAVDTITVDRISENLLNPLYLNIGETVQWNTGEIIKNEDFVVWLWIPVIAGKQLFFSRGNKIGQAPAATCYYDKDKIYKGYLQINATTGVTIPDDAAYISLALAKTAYSNYKDTWMLQYDSITLHQPYFRQLIVPHRNSDFVLSLAHQGYHVSAPIQTLPAYKAAYEYGFNVVECDINSTLDGELICCHNDIVYADAINKVIRQDYMVAVEPFTTPVTIEETTLANLQAYSWGAWKSAEYTNETVLLFEDLLKYAKHKNLYVMVDHAYHVATKPELFDKFKVMVDKYGMRDRCYITSVGEGIAAWNPKAKVIYGTTKYSGPSDIQQLITYISNHPDVDPWVAMPYQQIDANKSAEIHSYGVKILVYTVDDLSDIYSVSQYADGIISNKYMVSDANYIYS